MASHVVVALDTTAPGLSVDWTQDPGDETLLSFTPTTNESAEIRVWGAIDASDPLNADYGETQGAAPWIAYSPGMPLRAAPAGGWVYVQARDEVWNESAPVGYQVQIGVVPPEPPVRPRPSPPSATPGGHRLIRSRSRLRPGATCTITRTAVPRHTRSRRVRHGTPRIVSMTTVRGHIRGGGDGLGLGVSARIRSHSASASSAALWLRPGETAIRKRPEGPKAEEDLDILGLI